MNKQTAIYQPRKSLAEQRYDVILAHILDPENSPIPEEYQAQLNRVISAAQMLDKFHPSSVIPRLQAKYRITQNQARVDIKLSQELFKSRHEFDWDYWQQWQIKDLVDVIRTCKFQQKHKERVAAHKVLQSVIGEKQVGVEDPKRMEKNVYYIQLNNNNNTINLPLDKIKGLTGEEIRVIVEAMSTNIDTDEQIAEVLNT